MPYAFDDERDPAIHMHIHGWVTDAEIQQMLDDLDALVARERPFAVVFDCTDLRVPQLAQVRRFVRWFGDNFDAAARYHRGVACVITTPMIRGTLRTAMQLQRMPMPVHMVSSCEEGFEWVQAKLDEVTTPLGPRAREGGTRSPS